MRPTLNTNPREIVEEHNIACPLCSEIMAVDETGYCLICGNCKNIIPLIEQGNLEE